MSPASNLICQRSTERRQRDWWFCYVIVQHLSLRDFRPSSMVSTLPSTSLILSAQPATLRSIASMNWFVVAHILSCRFSFPASVLNNSSFTASPDRGLDQGSQRMTVPLAPQAERVQFLSPLNLTHKMQEECCCCPFWSDVLLGALRSLSCSSLFPFLCLFLVLLESPEADSMRLVKVESSVVSRQK